MGSDSFEWVDPNQCQSGSAYQAILKGSRPAVDIPASQYIDRPEAIEKVMKLLEDPIPRRYNIVTGPAGSGKTTTIKKACSLVGQGVIYVHLNAVTIKSKTYLVPIINTDATFQHIRGLVAEALNIKGKSCILPLPTCCTIQEQLPSTPSMRASTYKVPTVGATCCKPCTIMYSYC